MLSKIELGQHLVKLLGDNDTINKMNAASLDVIIPKIRELGISSDYSKEGLPRFMAGDYYKKNSGLVNMFLLANNPLGLSPDQPVFNIGRGVGLQVKDRWEPYSLKQMTDAIMRRTNYKILDLENRTLISREQYGKLSSPVKKERSHSY